MPSESELEQQREILLAINPVVPTLSALGQQNWQSMRLLSEDVREFGWNGSENLPEVRRLLAGVAKAAEPLIAAARERERLMNALETNGIGPYLRHEILALMKGSEDA